MLPSSKNLGHSQKPREENKIVQLIVDKDTRDGSSEGENQPEENKPNTVVQQGIEHKNTDTQKKVPESQVQKIVVRKNRVQKAFSTVANTTAYLVVPENVQRRVNISGRKIIGLLIAALLIGGFIFLFWFHGECETTKLLTRDIEGMDINKCEIDPNSYFTTLRLDTHSRWEGQDAFQQSTAFWQVKFLGFASKNASNFQDVLDTLREKVNVFLAKAINLQTFDLLQYFLHTRFVTKGDLGFAQLMPSFSLTSFVQNFQISKLQFFRSQQFQNCDLNGNQNCGKFSVDFEAIQSCGDEILGPFLKYDINRLGVSSDYYKISRYGTEFQLKINLLKEMQNDGIAQFFDSDTCEESPDIIKNTTLYSQLDYPITVREIPYFDECVTCKELDIGFDFALVNALDFCNKNIEICSNFYHFENNVAEFPSPEVFMKIKQIAQSRYRTSSASFYDDKIGKFAYTKYELGNEYSIVPEIIPSCNLCTLNQTNLSEQRDCYKEFDIVLHHYLKQNLTSNNTIKRRNLLQDVRSTSLTESLESLTDRIQQTVENALQEVAGQDVSTIITTQLASVAVASVQASLDSADPVSEISSLIREALDVASAQLGTTLGEINVDRIVQRIQLRITPIFRAIDTKNINIAILTEQVAEIVLEEVAENLGDIAGTQFTTDVSVTSEIQISPNQINVTKQNQRKFRRNLNQKQSEQEPANIDLQGLDVQQTLDYIRLQAENNDVSEISLAFVWGFSNDAEERFSNVLTVIFIDNSFPYEPVIQALKQTFSALGEKVQTLVTESFRKTIEIGDTKQLAEIIILGLSDEKNIDQNELFIGALDDVPEGVGCQAVNRLLTQLITQAPQQVLEQINQRVNIKECIKSLTVNLENSEQAAIQIFEFLVGNYTDMVVNSFVEGLEEGLETQVVETLEALFGVLIMRILGPLIVTPVAPQPEKGEDILEEEIIPIPSSEIFPPTPLIPSQEPEKEEGSLDEPEVDIPLPSPLQTPTPFPSLRGPVIVSPISPQLEVEGEDDFEEKLINIPLSAPQTEQHQGYLIAPEVDIPALSPLKLPAPFLSPSGRLETLTITHEDIKKTLGEIDFGFVRIGESSLIDIDLYNGELIDNLENCGARPTSAWNSNFQIVDQTCGNWTSGDPDPNDVVLENNKGSSCRVTMKYTPHDLGIHSARFELVCNDTSYNGYSNPWFYIGLLGQSAQDLDVSSVLKTLVLNHLGFTASKSYYYSAQQLSWTESLRRCESLGGNLLQLDSNTTELVINLLLQTNSFYQIAKKLTGKTNFWIGLQNNYGHRQWTSAINFDYNNACSKNQSSNMEQQISCVASYLKLENNNNGVPSSCWQDLECESKNAFVCEFVVDVEQQVGSILQPSQLPYPPLTPTPGVQYVLGEGLETKNKGLPPLLPPPPPPPTQEVLTNFVMEDNDENLAAKEFLQKMEPQFFVDPEDLQPQPKNIEPIQINDSGYEFKTNNNQNYDQYYQFSVLVSLSKQF